jgi:hypothetical protein
MLANTTFRPPGFTAPSGISPVLIVSTVMGGAEGSLRRCSLVCQVLKPVLPAAIDGQKVPSVGAARSCSEWQATTDASRSTTSASRSRPATRADPFMHARACAPVVYQVILPVNYCCRHLFHDGNHMDFSAPSELVDLQALVRRFVERELAPLERAVDDAGSDLGGVRTRGVERDGRWAPDARIATSRAKLLRHRDSEFRLPATCSAALAGVLAAAAAVYRVHMLYFEWFAARTTVVQRPLSLAARR